MSHEFFNPESEYEAYARLNPEAYKERERVKKLFREKLEALVNRVNKEVADQYHVSNEVRGVLDEAAKDFFAKIPEATTGDEAHRRWKKFYGPLSPFPKGHHGRWELLTVEDIKMLDEMGISCS